MIPRRGESLRVDTSAFLNDTPTVRMILKSLLAVYVSLYLVLPGCLCQILSAFGVGVCEVMVSVEKNAPVIVGSEETGICHCDQHLTKTAEAIEVRSQECVTPAQISSAFSVYTPSLFPASFVPRLHPRGPPGSIRWTSAPQSGVFLI